MPNGFFCNFYFLGLNTLLLLGLKTLLLAIRTFFNTKEQKLLRLEGLSVSLSSPLLRFS